MGSKANFAVHRAICQPPELAIGVPREVDEACRLHLRYRYAWWDCLLLASAIELGCTHFLSEDLQDGQRIESLTIVDPFAHSPEQIPTSR